VVHGVPAAAAGLIGGLHLGRVWKSQQLDVLRRYCYAPRTPVDKGSVGLITRWQSDAPAIGVARPA
jgi:hypothetical protein